MSIDDDIHVQANGYATIPDEILNLEVSDRAIRLFAVLGRYAGKDGQAYPSRRTLAARLRCSPASVDRALSELETSGAIFVENRRKDNKSWLSSIYWLWPKVPGGYSHPRGYLSSPVTIPLSSPVTTEVTTDRSNPTEPLFGVDDAGYRSSSSVKDRFEEWWRSYPSTRGRAEALRVFEAANKRGLFRASMFDQLMAATANYAASRLVEDPRYTMRGSRFIGRDDHWRDWIGEVQGKAPDVDADWQDEIERRRAESTPMPDKMKNLTRSMKGQP